MHKPGFTLIELMLASFMASVISIIMLTAFAQSFKFQKIIDDFFIVSVHETLSAHQLERDLMGAFIPLQAEKITQSVSPELQNTLIKNQTNNNQNQQNSNQKKEKPIEKIFYATQKNDQCELLTFISNNTMNVYWNQKVGSARSKCVRIVYRLVADQDQPQSFILERQEGSILDFDLYNGKDSVVKKYALIKGIKSLKIMYSAGIVQEKNDSNVQQNNNIQSKNSSLMFFKIMNTWNSDAVQQKDAKEKLELLPHFVHVEIELWDSTYNHSKKSVFTIPIIVPTVKKPIANPINTQRPNIPAAPTIAPMMTGDAVVMNNLIHPVFK